MGVIITLIFRMNFFNSSIISIFIISSSIFSIRITTDSPRLEQRSSIHSFQRNGQKLIYHEKLKTMM